MNVAYKPVPEFPEPAAAPKLSKTVAFMFLAPVILGAVSTIFFAIFGLRPPVQIMLIAGEAVIFGVLLLFLRSDRLSLSSIGWTLPEGKRSIWLEPLLGLAAGLAAFLLIRFAVIPIAAVGQRTLGGFQLLTQSTAPTAGRIIFSVIVAPFVEEAVFRGYGITGLRPRLGAGWALVATSLFFGLYHFGYGLWGMFQLGITGFLYGLIFLWRKNLPAPMAGHAAVNLLLILFR